jgi:hypothetical protein
MSALAVKSAQERARAGMSAQECATARKNAELRCVVLDALPHCVARVAPFHTGLRRLARWATTCLYAAVELSLRSRTIALELTLPTQLSAWHCITLGLRSARMRYRCRARTRCLSRGVIFDSLNAYEIRCVALCCAVSVVLGHAWSGFAAL